jgi:hypothetical protein
VTRVTGGLTTGLVEWAVNHTDRDDPRAVGDIAGERGIAPGRLARHQRISRHAATNAATASASQGKPKSRYVATGLSR